MKIIQADVQQMFGKISYQCLAYRLGDVATSFCSNTSHRVDDTTHSCLAVNRAVGHWKSCVRAMYPLFGFTLDMKE